VEKQDRKVPRGARAYSPYCKLIAIKSAHLSFFIGSVGLGAQPPGHDETARLFQGVSFMRLSYDPAGSPRARARSLPVSLPATGVKNSSEELCMI